MNLPASWPLTADLTIGPDRYALRSSDGPGLVTAVASALGLEVTVHSPTRPLDAPTLVASLDASATSLQAAERALPKSGSRRRALVNILRHRPALGCTDDELEVLLNLRHQTVSAARRTLVIDGWIQPMRTREGTPIVRRTRTGAEAQVWTLTPGAFSALREQDLEQ